MKFWAAGVALGFVMLAAPATAQNACSNADERTELYACLNQQHGTIFDRNRESLGLLGIPYSVRKRECPPRENLVNWAACLTVQNRRIDGQARAIQRHLRALQNAQAR